MESVIRAAVIYLVLLLLFRVAGKRSLAQLSPFDLIILLIISEAIQEALIGGDSSMTNAFLIVVTLLGIDIGLSLLKQRSDRLDKLLDDVPLVLVADGTVLQGRLDKSRVDVVDILGSAREMHGLERLDQIKYAVLEPNGGISIVPKPQPSVQPS